MTATFDSLFRQWQLASEAAAIAEETIQHRLLSKRFDGESLPKQQEIDEAKRLRASAIGLMDAAFVALTLETPGRVARVAVARESQAGASPAARK